LWLRSIYQKRLNTEISCRKRFIGITDWYSMDSVKVVSPYLFVLCYIGYVIMGITSFSLVSYQFIIYPVTFLFIGVGLTLYVLGCQIVLPDKRRFYFLLLAVVVTFYAYREYGVLGLGIPVFGMIALSKVEKMKVEWFLALGVSLLVIQLFMGGIPLMDSQIRRASVTPLFVFGYSFLFLGLTFMIVSKDLKYVAVASVGSLILLSLFTFRVYIMELVIAVFVSLYMLRKIRVMQVIISAVPLFLLILVIGYIGVSYQEWKFNPLELFLFRPAFTFGVLNKVVHEAQYLGIAHGEIWLKVSSAEIMGTYLFGYESNITSTIMGPLIFDGGIAELGVMAFFGAVANTVYRKAVTHESKIPYYSILMAMFLVGIDVSFIPSIVFLFLAGLYLVSAPGT
jgi:hypothetical protein